MSTTAERFAKDVIDGMPHADRGDLMDALVLGTYDWMDWFDDPPPRGFTRAAYEILRRMEERS